MPELQRLRPDHAPALLVFERENRTYFAARVPDRGDAYFDEFADRHRELIEAQEAGEIHFHVLVAESGEIVGRVNLVDVDAGTGSAELGYRLAEKATGRGFATRGVREVCRLAVEEYGLSRLTAFVALGNAASSAVLARAGFGAVGSVTLDDDEPGTAYELDLGESAVRDVSPDGSSGASDLGGSFGRERSGTSS
ncbi:GNAT family N-acetyltransferase [Streptomyces sp. NPDC056501]|uniref:GNAT family N-acetyltransferase n=1 Tax=Streptomyces sp. NPDC056501 TaxID=3345841 RepID=UPI0036BCA0E0